MIQRTPDPQRHSERLNAILRRYQEFRQHIVPLCAAETPISDYVRSFLGDPIHEQYAMGGPLVPAFENFIGAQHVLDLHQLTIDLCRSIFGVSYADPRPLSGTGAVTNLLMTLSEPGQRILLQTPSSGGHASMAPVCRRLGLDVIDMPYDYEHFQIPSTLGEQIDLGAIDFVLFAPSEILYPPCFAEIGLPEDTTLIYDATQSLGLIASGHAPSPFDSHPRLVVSAGTHKTLPGPSCGLLMTKNDEIARRLDSELSPRFVRHSQPHHIAALCASLVEQESIGARYSQRILEFTSILSTNLLRQGLSILQDGERCSETHQIFVHIPQGELDRVYRSATAAGITLNAKRKPLFRDTGIRLGVQEIARYQWTLNDLKDLAVLISDVVRVGSDPEELLGRVRELARRNVFAPDMQLTAPPS